MSFGRRGNSSPRGGWEGVILFFLMLIFKYLLASTLLMLFYWGVMRRRASYRLRRNYLMLIPLLGLMGFMHFNVTETSTDDDIDPRQTPVAPTVVHYVPASGALTEVTEPTEVIEEDDPSSRPMEPMAYLVEKEADSADLHLESLLDNVLPLVSVLLLLFGLCQVVKMLMLKAKLPCTRTAEGYGLIRSAEVVTPFSFGRTIFLPSDIDPDCEEMVLLHEKAHIAHGHYWEVWGIDLLVCFLWFNPIVWLCRNELLKVHEFEADHDVLGQGIDKYDYQMSLLQMSMNVSCPVASGFSKPLIYQRFVEMKASVAGSLSLLGKVGLLAWVAGLFGIFSFYACQVTTVQSEGNPTPSSELFATLDSLPRLEKPETFTFEYICDSLCRDTVLYVFLSDDFFHFSNPVPAETLHVKDGKMTFQMELDHVIGMKWGLLPDNRLGFEHFCSPGDTIWQFATRNEETHNREWRSGESQTYRANVDKYIHEFRELTHWQSPHMPKFDCTQWAEPQAEVERGGLWHPEKGSDFCVSCVKNVFFTDTATIVHVAPTFKFVVNHFHFYDENRTYLMDDQGNEYKYIKTIYPSFHLDAAVFGTYGVFEPINPNNIKSFSLMGPEPTVYTTIKNIRPKLQKVSSLAELKKLVPNPPEELVKTFPENAAPSIPDTPDKPQSFDSNKIFAYSSWNNICERFRSNHQVEYVDLTGTVTYGTELDHNAGSEPTEELTIDSICKAERHHIVGEESVRDLYEMIAGPGAMDKIGDYSKTSYSRTFRDGPRYKIAFEKHCDTLYFTYVESRIVPLPLDQQELCRVVVNGEERPDIQSKEQVKLFLKQNNIQNYTTAFVPTPHTVASDTTTLVEPTLYVSYQ